MPEHLSQLLDHAAAEIAERFLDSGRRVALVMVTRPLDARAAFELGLALLAGKPVVVVASEQSFVPDMLRELVPVTDTEGMVRTIEEVSRGER